MGISYPLMVITCHVKGVQFESEVLLTTAHAARRCEREGPPSDMKTAEHYPRDDDHQNTVVFQHDRPCAQVLVMIAAKHLVAVMMMTRWGFFHACG